MIKNFVGVFCDAIETDLKKKDSLFSKANYEHYKKDWKSSSFQQEQAVEMDTNGDGEIDLNEFKIWFREFFTKYLSTLFVKRAKIEIDFKELIGINTSDKGFSKALLQVQGGTEGKVAIIGQSPNVIDTKGGTTPLDGNLVSIDIEFSRNPGKSLQKYKPYNIILAVDPNHKKSIIKKASAKSNSIEITKYLKDSEDVVEDDFEETLTGNNKQTNLVLKFKLKLSADNSDELKQSM